MIFNQDKRFLNAFWKRLFKRIHTELCLTTAYHLSANDQSEWSIQTIEIAFRCMLIEYHEFDWNDILSEIEFSLNITVNFLTEQTSFQMLYDINFIITMTSNSGQHIFADNFINVRLEIQQKVNDAITLTEVWMSLYYD